MKKLLERKEGITLIALVITIIIMIVLASVSINAIVGDNGIITQAQNATVQNSIANLEEYLQEIYVENYDELTNYSTKVEGLSILEEYTYYFYNPYREAGVSNLSYIVTSDGYVLYLINKSELPEEIQDLLIGGDAGDGTYSDYASLNDVYGVTSNLKVYYCSGGVDTITGLTIADLDVDDPARKVTIYDSGVASVLESLSYINRNEDGTFSAQELRSITDLTLDNTSISSLSDLYNLSNLQKITFENISLSTLDGLQNCPKLYYVYNKGSTIGNYTAVGKLGDQLEYLYFYNITDSELETACSKTVGIGSYDLENLTYFAVVGNTSYINSETFWHVDGRLWYYSSGKSRNTITSIESLANLTDTTKEAIQYMSLQNNEITSLSSLAGFDSLILLRAEYNSLEDLSGIEDVTSLQYLCVAYNSLTSLTEFAEDSKIYSFCVNGNSSLTTLAGLDNCSSLYNLYAMDCDFGNGIETSTKSTTDSLASLDGKTKLYFVDLRNNSNLIWIDYLSNCTAIRILKLDGCTNINSKSMYAIKSIIDTCGSDASYDSSYSLALLDSNTTSLNLSDETLSQDEFEVIGNYTEITYLSLKNVKIVDKYEEEITNENDNELDKLVTEVLSKLTSMKYLQVNGISNLSTIDYVESMESLIELDVRNTSITDLSLLENMTEKAEKGNSTFKLLSLEVNNKGTDLSLIPKTISLLSSVASKFTSVSGVPSSMIGGLVCSSSDVLNSLNGSDINRLMISCTSSVTSAVDLSDCSLLEEAEIYYGCSYFKLPSCVKYVRCRLSEPLFSEGTELNLLYYYSISSLSESTFKNITYCKEFYGWYVYNSLRILNWLDGKELEIFRSYYLRYEDLSNVSIPEDLSYLLLGDSSTKNNKITLDGVDSFANSEGCSSVTTLIISGTSLSSLAFLNFFTGLNELNLSYNYLTGLDELTNEFSNVMSLNLSYNSITGLYGIQHFTGLQTLNISYNTTLGDSCTYDGATYSNLGLLTDLYNTNKTLTKVTLTGCTGITADSTNLYWTALNSISGLTVTGP